MKLSLYPVLPPLSTYIREICSMESTGFYSKSGSFRVLPDACVEFFINFGGQHEHPFQIGGKEITDRFFVTTRMSRFVDVTYTGPVSFITICFFPGKAWPFFDMPMKELINHVVSLESAWGPGANQINEVMESSATTAGRVQLLQELLVRILHKNIKKEASYDFGLQRINQYYGNESVEQVAGKAGLSCRQMGRKFDRHMGISPKEFARMRRFLHSLQLLKRPHLSLTQVAYKTGYYDQAHFIHETQSFAGMTPHQIRSSVNVLY